MGGLAEIADDRHRRVLGGDDRVVVDGWFREGDRRGVVGRVKLRTLPQAAGQDEGAHQAGAGGQLAQPPSAALTARPITRATSPSQDSSRWLEAERPYTHRTPRTTMGRVRATSAEWARGVRRRRGTAGATALAGLSLVGAAALLVNSWRAQLPNPVASHWGVNGEPNGFSTVNAAIGVLLVSGLLLVLGFTAITLWLGQSAITRRIGAAAAIWSALFLSIVTVGSLYGQRGVADARAAPGISGVLLVAVVASLPIAVIVAILVPGDPVQPTAEPVDAGAPRVPLTAGAETVWSGAAESRVALVCGLAVAGLMSALAVLTQFWMLFAVAVIVFALIASMSIAVVRIDGTGVTIRSPLGWPRTHVPLDEVVRADIIEVRPLRDFGGWGWRVGRGGRVGIALRGGDSLLIERTGDRSTVVTVDGALAAAGTLNSLADRARHA